MQANEISTVMNQQQTTSPHQPHIEDIPASRVRDIRDVINAMFAFLAGILVVLAAVYLRGATLGVQADAHHASALVPWLVELPMSLLQQVITIGVVLAVLVNLLIRSQWVQSVSAVIAMFLGLSATELLNILLTHYGSTTLLYALTGSVLLNGDTAVIIPDIIAGLCAFLSTAGNHRFYTSVRWSWNTIIVFTVITVMLNVYPLAAIACAVALGRCIGLLIRFAVGTQNKGAWGADLIQALALMGYHVHALQRLDYAQLEQCHAVGPVVVSHTNEQTIFNTALSTFDDQTPRSRLYQVTCCDSACKNFQGKTQTYIASVSDEHTSAAGYVTQIWHLIRLASGIDLRTDRSVSQASHHHADILLALRNIGITVPHVLARTEYKASSITLFEDGSQFTQVDWQTVSDAQLLEVLQQLNLAHSRGITHRNIGIDSFAMYTNTAYEQCAGQSAQDDVSPRTHYAEPTYAHEPIQAHEPTSTHMVLSGWIHGDDASSASTIALDRVQALTALTCQIGLERTLQLAQQVWDDATLASLVPFVQRVAVTSSTKNSAQYSRKILVSLRERLTQLIPDNDNEPLEPASLARFSPKNILTWALVIIAVSITVTQINPHEFIVALQSANPWMAGLCFVFGIASWVGSALALGVFIDPDKRKPVAILASQAVGTFTTASMPAGVGPAVINLQYVRKCGYKTTTASAIMSAVVAVQAATIVILLLIIGVFTGRNTLSGMIPTNLVVAVIGIVALIASGAMIIPYTRRIILEHVLPKVLTYARQLLDLLTRPQTIALASLGWLLQSVLLGLSFWAALLAFGQQANPIETIFIFVLTNTVASAVPTPGGLGAIEAALALGFTSLGVPYAVALSSTLLFRLLTYWLRLPIGAVALRWMNATGAL